MVSRGLATHHEIHGTIAWVTTVCGVRLTRVIRLAVIFILTPVPPIMRGSAPARRCCHQRDVFGEPWADGDGAAVWLPSLEHVEMGRLRNIVGVALVEEGGNGLGVALNLEHFQLIAKGFRDTLIVQVFPALTVCIVQDHILITFVETIQEVGEAFRVGATHQTLVEFVRAILLQEVVIDRTNADRIPRAGGKLLGDQASEIGFS